MTDVPAGTVTIAQTEQGILCRTQSDLQIDPSCILSRSSAERGQSSAENLGLFLKTGDACLAATGI